MATRTWWVVWRGGLMDVCSAERISALMDGSMVVARAD
jgi:hypothetical protein